ncbi:MAG: aldo/keto reductase [Planctomycetaceae bacterium]|nr:aldo/keto reductase [Planctomycetaceae bacterium]
MKRREFLQKGAAATGLLSLSNLALIEKLLASENKSEHKAGFIPKRRYGKTEVMLSVIGFGGIVVKDTPQEEANQIVAQAYERGVNYYDVAPGYGNAEEILGPALEPYRKKVFLACKTGQREYVAAKEEFERSLKRLRTDHFDLYQLHGITDVQKDVERAFAEDGVMKLLFEEKKQGRIRYLGFSAHSHEAALEAMRRYDFDSILFPVNFAGYLQGAFSPEIIEKARQKEMAVLALKMLARQRAPEEDPIRALYPKCWYQPITDIEEAKLAMAFTLSMPVTAAVPPGDARLFTMALDLVNDIKPITPEQLEKLKVLASTLKPIFEKNA